jgi:glycosyltransferase involved in cell wall biosynthesis
MRVILQALSLSPDVWTAPAFELREVLQGLADEGLDEIIALVPGTAAATAPTGLTVHTVPPPASALADLAFEFLGAARLAASLGGDVLYGLEESAPWSSPIPVVATASIPRPARPSLGSRLENAVRRASVGGAARVLLAEDLPQRTDLRRVQRVPPLVSTGFHPAGPADSSSQGDDYVLAWVEGRPGLKRILAAWSWVDASLGDSVRLRLLCPTANWAEAARREADGLGIGESVECAGFDEEPDVAGLYRRARVLLHAGDVSTPQVFRWALASGVALAAESSAAAAAVAGTAAYLVPASDTRALGAAVLTLLVEDSIAGALRERGLERAQAYEARRAVARRLEILGSIVAGAT